MALTKKTLLYSDTDYTMVGRNYWITKKLSESFNIELFDPNATYNSDTHVLVIDRYDHNCTGWHIPYQERGFKIVVEYFWDTGKNEKSTIEGQTLYLRASEWIWMHDYLMNQHLNYRQRHVGNFNPNKFFLLLMNLARDTRDQLFEHTKPYLEESLYSYRGRGIAIAGDDPKAGPGTVTQHYANIGWYEQTNFSLVAETLPQTNPPEQLFVSEKTFKPIALKHPFIVHGSRGTLEYLHKLGFQTFDHIIDESYDLGATVNDRITAIDALLTTLYEDFKKGKVLFGDTESQNRIQHNYNRFYDESIVNNLWQTQIVDQIMEFADA